MMCKWLGPGWFIPATSLGFGIASLGTAYVNNLSAACGVRFVLGIFEAGMLPGIAYYLSRWYRRSELTFRLSLYIVMAPLAGAFGGLLASGILTLDSVGSVTRWRMIFLIEGIITIGLSIIAFFTLTDRPETARWLTQEEKDLAIARVKSERVGQTAVLDGIDKTKTLRGIFSPVTLMVSFIFALNNIPVQGKQPHSRSGGHPLTTLPGLAFFAPTIVKTIYPDNTVVSQQLHTVPPYVVGAFFTLLVPFISWKIDRRNIFLILGCPLVMTGYIMFLATTEDDPMVRYGATFIITAGAFFSGALCNAQTSANLVSDTARAAGIGATVMAGNMGGFAASWSFTKSDAPNYPIGNGLNLAAASASLITATLLALYMKRDNKKRDQVDVDAKLAGLSPKQVEDLDWKHPGFRWKP